MPASFPSLQPHFCLKALLLQLDFCQLGALLQTTLVSTFGLGTAVLGVRGFVPPPKTYFSSPSLCKSCSLQQHQNCQLLLIILQNLWFAHILCHGVLHDNSTKNHKTIIFLSLKMEQPSLTSLTHSPFSNLYPVLVLMVFSIFFYLPAQFPLMSSNK